MTLKTKAFGDIITFTRASGGGRFNAQGQYEWLPANEPRIDYDPVTGECRGLLIEEQRTNLLTYSDQFDNAAWVKTGATVSANVAVSPDGTSTMDKIVETATAGNHSAAQSFTFVSGTSYSMAVYAKAGERTRIQIGAGNPATWAASAVFDLQAGTVAQVIAGTANIEPVGNGIYRCTVSGSALASAVTNRVVFLVSSGATVSYTGDGTSGIYISGAQFEAGAFPTSYIPTPAIFTGRASTGTYFDADGVMKIAAAGEARYTHAYVDGKWVSAGLLLEESRTNLLTHSSDFHLRSWVGVNGGTYTPDNALSPDGTIKATLIDLSASSTAYVSLSGFSTSGAATICYSFFVKGVAGETVGIKFNTNAQATVTATDGVTEGTTVAAKLVTLTGAWQRVSVYVAMSAAVTSGYLYLGDRRSGQTAKLFHVWGAQLEVGAFPTSYIPTTTAQVTRAADTSTSSQVTRAADLASVNELSPWFSASEGTLFAEFVSHPAYPVAGKGFVVANFGDGTYANRIALNSSTGTSNTNFDVALNSSVQRVSPGQYGQGVNKIAGAYSVSVAKSSLNGALSATGTLAAIPPVTRLYIGQDHIAAHMNGHIRSIRYFPRALSNTELQRITA